MAVKEGGFETKGDTSSLIRRKPMKKKKKKAVSLRKMGLLEGKRKEGDKYDGL